MIGWNTKTFNLRGVKGLRSSLRRPREGLDAAEKEVYKAGDSKIGDSFREIRSKLL